MGPVMVLPAKARSRPIPEDEVPLVLHKISRPSLYGSQWRSGMKRIGKNWARFQMWVLFVCFFLVHSSQVLSPLVSAN